MLFTLVKLEAPLKLGDGIVFDAGRPDEKEEGGRIYGIKASKQKIANAEASILEFGYGNIDFSRVRVGDKIWKTNDPELDKRLRQSFAGDVPRFQRPIEIEVHGLAGKPLTLIARDEAGHVAQVESSMPLAVAEKLPLSTEKLREQLGRLGGTPFKLGELKNFLSGEVLVPVSELNRLRIVRLLLQEQLGVNAIAERLDISQYNVSKSLRILKEAGLLEMEKSGKQRLYAVVPEFKNRLAKNKNILELDCCSFRFDKVPR